MTRLRLRAGRGEAASERGVEPVAEWGGPAADAEKGRPLRGEAELGRCCLLLKECALGGRCGVYPCDTRSRLAVLLCVYSAGGAEAGRLLENGRLRKSPGT